MFLFFLSVMLLNDKMCERDIAIHSCMDMGQFVRVHPRSTSFVRRWLASPKIVDVENTIKLGTFCPSRAKELTDSNEIWQASVNDEMASLV